MSVRLRSCPQADFTLQTLHGPISIHLSLPVWLATALLFVLAIAFACGMASTFKYISDDFSKNMGVVSGIVGMTGGLGGFLLPILFGITLDWLGVNSSCFMLLYGITWVSLILLYITVCGVCPCSIAFRSLGPRRAFPADWVTLRMLSTWRTANNDCRKQKYC